MKNLSLTYIFIIFTFVSYAQKDIITVSKNTEGMQLEINGVPFLINGMNWDYVPIGGNYSYSLWNQSDELIRAALDDEMSLLKNMGVNTIRQYAGIPPKWVTYIYKKYGIYTMINHTFGRYGLTLDGTWVPNTEYADKRVHDLLINEVKDMVNQYKGTPGVLLYLLGNENNYGLFWDGAETEDIPLEDRKSTKRAKFMYKLFNEATLEMKKINKDLPIAICNGDLLFIDIIKEECKDIDIFGTNMYRGISFRDAFQKVKDELDLPIMFTEFGSDAFNALDDKEDQKSQAYYLVGNWKEIYENASGKGENGNCIGGFTFQFSDGWWKFGQTKNLNIHDNNASWSNGGYQSDFSKDANNMNEEWFGICAKGPTNQRGLYQLHPRAAYYALKKVHQLNPYSEGVTLASIENYFSKIDLMDITLNARGDKALLENEQTKKIKISNLRADIQTFNTGGKYTSTPDEVDPNVLNYPNKKGFDHLQSFYVGIEANPTNSIKLNVNFNVLGNVPENPINEIFYENSGRPRIVETPQGQLELSSINRLKVYQADFSWQQEYFDLKGFYRTGHYHWGYEGDFFGLYPEANYGPNIDIYNGIAPYGFEMSGKKQLNGLKMAFGPQLWWGANPAVLLKYTKNIKGFDITGMYHEDVAKQSPAVSSIAVPVPQTRRATLHIKKKWGKLGVELGGIWAGQTRVGETFQIAGGTEGNYTIYQDKITANDLWGGKIKLTYAAGPIQWYGQSAAMGLVAGGGADLTQTYTGWRLKDSGSGNQINILSGFTYGIGNLQIAPNFLWQKPIVGPMPANLPAPGRPRNVIDDPFAVRANRETIAGELLLTFDPTPGTWMYEWNNDEVEDAKFAMNADFVYRHHPTIMDGAIGIFSDGRTTFPFPGSPPAQDLWEVNTRIVSKINPSIGLIANLYGGNAQARGSDPRLIHRYGGDLRFVYKKIKLTTIVKVDDWGPYDYHRDFNLTYPLQLALDLSTHVGKTSWFNLPETKIGVRYTWRSLDQYSNRYCPTHSVQVNGDITCDPTAIGYDNGNEWEFRTYVQFNINN